MSVRCRIGLLIAAMLPSASVGRAEDAKLVRRVYQVADLIASMGETAKADYPTTAAAPTTGSAISWEILSVKGETQLVKRITRTIAPRSWREHGGPGTIEYTPLTASLVVHQSPATQEQIAAMLTALRRFYNLEVALDVKFVLISDNMFQCLKRIFNEPIAWQCLMRVLGDPEGIRSAKSDPRGIAFLDEKELFLLMETLQGDTRAKVRQAPKLVVPNGRIARINSGVSRTFVTGLDISQQDGRFESRPKTETIPLGTQVCLRPIILADRGLIQLQFDATVSNLASGEVPRVPIVVPGQSHKTDASEGKPKSVTQYIEQPRVERVHVGHTLSISDRKTVVLSGWQYSQVRATRTEVPILGDLPYIGELFRTTQYQTETEHLLIFVTPRIVESRKKEEKALPNPKAIDSPKESVGGVTRVPIPAWVGEKLESRNDSTIVGGSLILPLIGSARNPQCAEPPDEARILRAMPPIKNPFPGIFQVNRDNIQIMKERVVDRVDSPRCYPLVGRARLHHCDWKCTVYYYETVEGIHPLLSLRFSKPKVEVVYLDSDHLHLCNPDEKAGVTEQNTSIQRCFAVTYPGLNEAKAKRVGDLLKKFADACDCNRFEDSMKLAEEALKLDPTCFRKH